MSKSFLDPTQLAALAALPHKGQGALYFLGSRTGTGAPTFSVSLSAGKDMLEDLSAAAAAIPMQPGVTAPPLRGPLP
jgi:hypothetical protein